MAKINEILKGGRSPFRNEKDPKKVVGEWSPTDETVLLDNDGSTIVGSNPESREITTQHAATNEIIQAESDEAYINSFKNFCSHYYNIFFFNFNLYSHLL